MLVPPRCQEAVRAWLIHESSITPRWCSLVVKQRNCRVRSCREHYERVTEGSLRQDNRCRRVTIARKLQKRCVYVIKFHLPRP